MEQDEIAEELAKMDVQTRTLIAEVDLGRQAKEFFASDLGRYILGCATQEIQEAQMGLAEVNWWNIWKVRKLQNKIWRARSLIGWMADLVRQGKQAEVTLTEGEGNG